MVKMLPTNGTFREPQTHTLFAANKSPENQPPRYQPGSVPMRDVRPSRTDDSGSDSAGESQGYQYVPFIYLNFDKPNRS